MLWHNANIYQTLNSNSCLQRKKERYDITLHPNAMQNHIMHAIPKVHERTLNMEL
jgi:hypothetical protein